MQHQRNERLRKVTATFREVKTMPSMRNMPQEVVAAVVTHCCVKAKVLCSEQSQLGALAAMDDPGFDVGGATAYPFTAADAIIRVNPKRARAAAEPPAAHGPLDDGDALPQQVVLAQPAAVQTANGHGDAGGQAHFGDAGINDAPPPANDDGPNRGGRGGRGVGGRGGGGQLDNGMAAGDAGGQAHFGDAGINDAPPPANVDRPNRGGRGGRGGGRGGGGDYVTHVELAAALSPIHANITSLSARIDQQNTDITATIEKKFAELTAKLDLLMPVQASEGPI